MRTFENLVKRINLVEIAYKELPMKLNYKNTILAYRMQTYLKNSYKILCLNGVELKKVEQWKENTSMIKDIVIASTFQQVTD